MYAFITMTIDITYNHEIWFGRVSSIQANSEKMEVGFKEVIASVKQVSKCIQIVWPLALSVQFF